MRFRRQRRWPSGDSAVALVICVWLCARARAAELPGGKGTGGSVGAAGTPGSSGAKEGTYILQRTSDGGYVHSDQRFEAHIAPDGQVTFKDVHGHVGVSLLGLPLFGDPSARGERPSVQRALSDWVRPNPKRAIPFSLPEQPGFADPVLALPAEMRRPMGPMLITVSGTFDLTDELMLRFGQGWYRYEKAKFLSATFEFRLKMAVAEHRRLLRAAIDVLPDRLDALWADDGYTPREKRRILFLLWAEADRTEPSTGAVVETIEIWIRRRLPRGSALAFSALELSECRNQIAGRAFSPYGAMGDAGVVQPPVDAGTRDAASP